MPRRLVVVLLIALVWGLALGATAFAGPSKTEERVARALEDLVDRTGGPPGGSILLRRPSGDTFIRAGVADVETQKPFTRNKHMRIASVSKAFSGAVALSMANDGVLSLDDTIAARLPSLPSAWGAVTLRQAMAHTSGLPDFTKDPGFLQYFSDHLQETGITKAELVDFVADEPLNFAPGSSYEYSNTDNVVIAMMAEAAAAKPYEQLLADHVLAPLELRRTALPGDSVLPGPRINGYDVDPIEDLTECCSMAFVSASGGLYSTPRELTRFVVGYVGGELFGDPVRAEQFQFVAGASSDPPGPGVNAGGLSVFRYRTGCGTVFGHTGNFPGYTQFTAARKSGRRAVTVSVNRQLSPTAVGVNAPEAFADLRRIYRLSVCALLD